MQVVRRPIGLIAYRSSHVLEPRRLATPPRRPPMYYLITTLCIWTRSQLSRHSAAFCGHL